MNDNLLKESLQEFENRYIKIEQIANSDTWLCISRDTVKKATGAEDLETLQRELVLAKVCSEPTDDAVARITKEVSSLGEISKAAPDPSPLGSHHPVITETFGGKTLVGYTTANFGVPITLERLEANRKGHPSIEFISHIFLELCHTVKYLHNGKFALNGFNERDILLYRRIGTKSTSFPLALTTKFYDIQRDESFAAGRQKDIQALCTIVYKLLEKGAGKHQERFEGYVPFKEFLKVGSERGHHNTIDEIMDTCVPPARKCLTRRDNISLDLAASMEALAIDETSGASAMDAKLRAAVAKAKSET